MNEKWIAIGLGIGGSACAAGMAWLGHKVKKLTKKVGLGIDQLADMEAKDISDVLIERSVEKAAEKEVSCYAKSGAKEALDQVRKEVKAQVSKAVSDTYNDLQKACTDELAKQVEAIDHKSLQKEVKEQAQEKILEKFDHNLDDILKDFSDNLDRVKKIYTSISDTLSERDTGKEIRLKVG